MLGVVVLITKVNKKMGGEGGRVVTEDAEHNCGFLNKSRTENKEIAKPKSSHMDTSR